MKNSKILLSVFMVLVIICVSVAPAFAIVAPEDVVSTTVHWSAKIDELVKEKMDEVLSELSPRRLREKYPLCTNLRFMTK